MKVLITGSHGFVGTNLIETLGDKYEFIRWDARSIDPLPEVEVVIHLAAIVHDTKHTQKVEDYFRVNTELTKSIFDLFLQSKAKKFILFSSIKAQDGDTPYAKSKKAAEEYILNRIDGDDTFDMHPQEKMVYILRPCMMFGQRNKGNLNLLYKVVRLGLPWPLSAYTNKRSFASIWNICFIIDNLLISDIAPGTYNVCDDESLSTNELVKTICECLKIKCRMWRIPKFIIKFCAFIGDYLCLPLNNERLSKLTENYVIDNSQIKKALGIDKLPYKTIDCLKASINYMAES